MLRWRWLLGYTNSLRSSTGLAERCSNLVNLVQHLDGRLTRMRVEFAAEREALLVSTLKDRLLYEQQLLALLIRYHDADSVYQAQISRLKSNIFEHISYKLRHTEEATAELESLKTTCKEEVARVQQDYNTETSELKLQLLKTKTDLSMCKLRCDKLSGKVSGRKKKDLSNLAKTWRRAKRVKAMVR
jgi:hypothetical protein